MPKPINNKVGKKIGYLTPVERIVRNTASNGGAEGWYKCICDCGNEVTIRNSGIHRVKSCGCYRREQWSKKANPLNDIIERTMVGYTRGAKDRNLEFLLTKKEFTEMIMKPCYFCGHEGRVITKYRGSLQDVRLQHNGIDRLDNSLSYSLENCVTCCKFCNYAKSAHSEEVFKNWVHDLATHQGYTKLI